MGIAPYQQPNQYILVSDFCANFGPQRYPTNRGPGLASKKSTSTFNISKTISNSGFKGTEFCSADSLSLSGVTRISISRRTVERHVCHFLADLSFKYLTFNISGTNKDSKKGSKNLASQKQPMPMIMTALPMTEKTFVSIIASRGKLDPII